MEVAVAVVQTSVSWDIGQNLAAREVLGHLTAAQPAILRTVLDTEDVSDWYLSQHRTDVLRPHHQASR